MLLHDSCCTQHAAAPCLLTCAVCHAGLRRSGATLRCTHNHSFDVGRDGYVNLLLKQRGGDTKPMLAARRQFLAAGHYQPLSDAINTMLAAQLHDRHGETRLLDAGCGEGYYNARLQRHLQSTLDTPCSFYGLDVSKDAVRMAAKQHKHICFFVADIKQRIHVPDQSIHALLNIFAPRNTHEFARVVAPRGLVLTVIPAPNHLREVRETLHLLSIEPHKQQRVVEQLQHRFTLVDTTKLEYALRLSSTSLAQLVMMTPNYWHEQRQRSLEQIDQLNTHAAFTILVFQRNR